MTTDPISATRTRGGVAATPAPGRPWGTPAASASRAGCCGPPPSSVSRSPGSRLRPPSAGSMIGSRRWSEGWSPARSSAGRGRPHLGVRRPL